MSRWRARLSGASSLRRAIVYTTTAVLLSGTALFEPGGQWRGFTVTEALIALAVVLLICTAFTVLPATWTVLEYRQARDYLDKDLQILAEFRPQQTPPSDSRVPVEPDSAVRDDKAPSEAVNQEDSV